MEYNEVHTPGIILFHSRSGQQVRIKYDAIALDISSERITIDDSRLGPVWGDHVVRIVFTAKHAAAQSTWSMNSMQTQW